MPKTCETDESIIEPAGHPAKGRDLVTIVDSIEGMESIAAEWQSLEQSAANGLTWFQSLDWCLTWMGIHGDSGYQPHIVVLRSTGVVSAIWPLMIERERFGVRVLRSMGDPHTQYGGLLLRNGTLTNDQAGLIRKAALSAADADAAVFYNIPSGSPLAQVIPADARVDSLGSQSALLDLGQYASAQAFLDGPAGDHGRKRRRRRTTLAKAGEMSFLACRPADPRFRELVSRCIQFKKAWLEKTGRYSTGLALPHHDRFLCNLSTLPDRRDGPLAFALCINGSPVAIEVGFLRHRHYFAYLGGFDWNYRQYSPGKVQMEQTIAWLISEGARYYDLLSYSDAYKETWSNKVMPLSTYLAPLTFLGRMYSQVWLNGARPMLKKAYVSMPTDIRSGVSLVVRKDAWIIG